MQDWRARIFHLTRNRTFLATGVASIMGVAIALSLGIHAFREKIDPAGDVPTVARHSVQEQLVESGRRLLHATTPDPAGLAEWIRLSAGVYHAEVADITFDSATLHLGRLDLGLLIDKHAGADSREVFAAFSRRLFTKEDTEKIAAQTKLEELAASSPAFVNEFLGDLLYKEKRYAEALAAYLKESHNGGASHSRDFGLRLALRLNDKEAMRNLCADPLVIQEAPPKHLWQAARMSGNLWLMFRSFLLMQMEQLWQPGILFLAIMAAAMWYVILVYSASPEPWRFVRYVASVLAGVASVWVIDWAQHHWGYYHDPESQHTMAHEILHWILYVGIPEEAAKLLLFLPFIPWLLFKKSGIKAALTAGCVGLGFALAENIIYYRDYGIGVAIARLVTANFMHISLTGVLGWHFWNLFRSRFHEAANFVFAFAGVSVAHGLYDFALNQRSSEMGLDIASIIILALGARFYFQLLHPVQGGLRSRMMVSSTAVFLFGCSLVIGTLMVGLVYQEQNLQSVTQVLKVSLSLVPVALVYVKEFNEV